MEPNRLDDLEELCKRLERQIEVQGRRIDFWGFYDKERERTRRELRLLWRGYFLLAVVVAMLLVGRLWQ